METAPKVTGSPATSRVYWFSWLSAWNGRAAGSKRGRPMFTVTWPSLSTRRVMVPPLVSTVMRRFTVSPRSRTKRAKQRAPLPHCSTSLPSALKMR